MQRIRENYIWGSFHFENPTVASTSFVAGNNPEWEEMQSAIQSQLKYTVGGHWLLTDVSKMEKKRHSNVHVKTYWLQNKISNVKT